MRPTFRLDRREFDSAMRQYIQYTSRTAKEVVDTKAYFIARRAVVETQKANKADIERDLGRLIKVKGIKGKLMTMVASKRLPGVSLLEAIIRARKYRKGEKQPNFEEVRALMRQMLSARFRSVAYGKSGWLPAIKTLAPFAKKAGSAAIGRDSAAKQVGAAKGFGRPSRGGWKGVAVICNTAASRHEKRGGFLKYIFPGLQRAFDHEARSMRQYVRDKLLSGARRIGIKAR